MTGTLGPIAARAGDLIDEASRALARAHQVDWVSDAADRYRAALTEAQQAVMRAGALVTAAQQALLAVDAAASQARTDECTSAARPFLGGSR